MEIFCNGRNRVEEAAQTERYASGGGASHTGMHPLRKMLHDEDDAPTMDEWLKEATMCQVEEIRNFAEYISKDRKAVEQACCTCFNNGFLEGTVNKTKTIKRSMFNRANADVLRAKLLYGNLKWDWNYHPN